MIFRKYILDENNQPVLEPDDAKRRDWMEGHDIRVGLTRFPEGPRVSTVFLSLDHDWEGGPPILWETMIFDTDTEEFDGFQERYTSYRLAVEGHINAVRRVMEKRYPKETA